MAGCPFCEVVTHKRIVKPSNLTTISNYCIVIYAVTTLQLGGRYMILQSLVMRNKGLLFLMPLQLQRSALPHHSDLHVP